MTQEKKHKAEDLEMATLQRLLATPPQPKPKKADDANLPKKRGRPKKKEMDSK